MQTLRDAVTTRLHNSQSALDAALEIGSGNTDELRRAVAEAERDLQAINAEEAGEMQAQQDEAEAAMADQAAREVDEAVTSMQADLRELAAIEIPNAALSVDAAMGVQRAGAALSRAREVESAASAKNDRLTQRLSSLMTERQAIVNKRSAGQGDDERDGQRLELIKADAEGLEVLIAAARNELQQAHAAAAAAQTRFDQVQAMWSKAVQDERHRVHKLLTEMLEAALIKAVRAVASGYEVGHHAATYLWQPSVEFQNVLKRGR